MKCLRYTFVFGNSKFQTVSYITCTYPLHIKKSDFACLAEQVDDLSENENARRDHRKSLVQTPDQTLVSCEVRSGYLRFMKSDLETLKGWRLYNPSRQPVQQLHCPHG